MSPQPAQPWYTDGLGFQCTQCGDCCTGEPGFVWVNQEEIAALARRLNLDVATFEAQFVHKVGIRKTLTEKENGDCVFLKDRKCTVYEDRPRQCRSWPFWESNLRSEKAWQETCAVCPGCGKGDLVPLEDIQRQLAMIRV